MPLVGLNADGKIYQGQACTIERLGRIREFGGEVITNAFNCYLINGIARLNFFNHYF